MIFKFYSNSSQVIGFSLSGKSTGESTIVEGRVNFRVDFEKPTVPPKPCTTHSPGECPPLSIATMRLREPLVENILMNGHGKTFRKNDPRDGTVTCEDAGCNGGSGNEVVMNGEIQGEREGKGDEGVPGDDPQEANANVSSNSDYSPIWKYSCRIPSPIGRGNSRGSQDSEEAIYETVYPTDQNHVGFPETPAATTPKCPEEDPPPPLPPRTKSLMRSLADGGHRPLERTMAVQLGAPVSNDCKKRPLPAPPADRQTKPHFASTAAGTSRNVCSGETGSTGSGPVVSEPSVRPKMNHCKLQSSQSGDSESSSISTDSKQKHPSSSDDTFSYNIVDLDEISYVRDTSHVACEGNCLNKDMKLSSQDSQFSSNASSCHLSDSETCDLLDSTTNVSSGFESDERCVPAVVSDCDKNGSCLSVADIMSVGADDCQVLSILGEAAPLATPDRDLSVLCRETAAASNVRFDSEDDARKRTSFSESSDCDDALGASALCVDEYGFPGDENIVDKHSAVADQSDFFPSLLNNADDSFDSKPGKFCECVMKKTCSESNLNIDSVCKCKCTECCTCLCDKNVAGKMNDSQTKNFCQNHGNCGLDKPIPSQCLRPLSLSSSSFTISSSSMHSDNSTSGAKQETSSDNTSPHHTDVSDSHNILSSNVASEAKADPEGGDSIDEALSSSSSTTETSIRPRRDPPPPPTTPSNVVSPVGDEDTPPAVPPHKPHHRLLKALVYPAVCPPTPTHHAKPQPPERTTSDRRDKELIPRDDSTKDKEERQNMSFHPKLSRQPSLRDWLRKYPKVDVSFEEPLPPSKLIFIFCLLFY